MLVVEDNAEMRTFVRSILAPQYRVLEAVTGTDGLEAARATLPDCIVTDVMMPGLDGFEMIAALREDPDTDCIPVVVLTARGDTGDRLTSVEAGADIYLAKPFEPEVLSAHVGQCIAAQHRLRERIQAQSQDASPQPPSSDSETASTPNTDPSRPPEAPLESSEAVVAHLTDVVESRLHDPDFSVDDMMEAAAMSRRSLERTLKARTDQTPNQFLRSRRLEAGAELLVEAEGTIAEVAYAVGFNSHSYFTRRFKEHFDCTPSAYVNRKTA